MVIEELDKKLTEVMDNFDNGMQSMMRNAETDEKTLEDIRRAAEVTKDALDGICASIIEYLNDK